MPLLWHTQRTLPTNEGMAIGAKGLLARTHGPKDRAAHKQSYAVAEKEHQRSRNATTKVDVAHVPLPPVKFKLWEHPGCQIPGLYEEMPKAPG